MDSKSAAQSGLHWFEKFDVGVIHLDAQRNVVALNDYARAVLPVKDKMPFNKLVTTFHPERSKPKVKFLLDEAEGCPMSSAVPMTMIINIPEQVLLIKVSRLADELGTTTGFILVFYDVTQSVSPEQSSSATLPHEPTSKVAGRNSMRLSRIPMVANQKVSFVDAEDVLSLESQGHYTRVLTREGYHFCNLSIGDLELRLDPELFLRVHRCFIVNLRAVRELGRDGTKTHVVLKGPATPHVPVSRGVLSRLKGALGLG
jgi:LytTR family transcriptional regulator, CO-responsive transcriptional regulator RcoM